MTEIMLFVAGLMTTVFAARQAWIWYWRRQFHDAEVVGMATGTKEEEEVVKAPPGVRYHLANWWAGTPTLETVRAILSRTLLAVLVAALVFAMLPAPAAAAPDPCADGDHHAVSPWLETLIRGEFRGATIYATATRVGVRVVAYAWIAACARWGLVILEGRTKATLQVVTSFFPKMEGGRQNVQAAKSYIASQVARLGRRIKLDRIKVAAAFGRGVTLPTVVLMIVPNCAAVTRMFGANDPLAVAMCAGRRVKS